ncbi:Protein mlp1 [Exophiala dermatitidis]|uniref:Nucleoprotein TPR n=1 Tax=Exophiala dermatitidis (strain ATCC 34100 / CBS 525.76 / NIH/UT8656) TaxID=858893 RepID=H6C4N4_EXODN|nr:nucleoprotein TPR [Exophiala dermatitidis NIH/UT8656]KAJ4518463.1 Protein mlp1 [Exophiala dermatitidis]EHY57655.1 nucleoprotein TPR [Exophiala dermatitidis NIH/UT8656]KAJ4550113.1 Protein mlp1 [Exophiala dermatitidis]KAJ4554525.1 Protein mlp1 [Exophiala dermatitidis]KAJ4571637.1 Protein mlp1 [Exophiala dermatitidis]
MAAAVDTRAISAFSSLPEASITSLIDSPTTELVVSFLQAIETRAKECEQTKSQKIKLEVELETVVRTNESKTKVLQNSRDKALAEASKLRVDLQTAENARSRLESEIEQLRSATANESTEINTLKSRIASLESANRDTLALLESKTTAYESLSQDLSAQHQKAVELRKTITTLEQSVQSANAALASARFKEQSLQQEVEILKKNNEWLENERKIKAEEHANFRKEKNARISELSRLNEQYISEVEALKRSESSLKHRLEEQMTKFEETLEEMQKLREEKISAEDAFRVELESVNRLAELQAASAETAKQRVQELSAALEEAREEAADEIGTIRAEIETEHNDRVAAEQRVAELEKTIEQLSSELEEARARPATPQRHTNGSGVTTPLRAGTPSGIFSPSSVSRPRAQMTMTQLFSEYKKLEGELAAEKRVSEQLRENLDAMVEELENNKPEIEELRTEHERLQSEVVEMSAIVDKANADRESAIKELRNAQGQLESRSKEVEVLTQQLRDMGSEIRFLLIEQHVREQGDNLTREEFDELERQAKEGMEQDMANLSETQQLINQRLIVFKNIRELQEQNENQLKTIRNLVSELESNEAKEKEQQNHALSQELEQARAQIASYQDELRTMVAQTKSFVKERDMFRNMLTRRGHLPANVQPTDFSRSLPIPAGGAESAAGSVADGENDYAKLLKDLQQHFDSYRQEAATDHSALKNQVDELSRKNSQLQAEISRTVGQLTAANQRYEMLQANYNSLKAENAEIQKRSWAAMENATKQELKTQQVAEELVEARGLLDSLRRDAANLKAEKDLWKSVEKRLIEDNESLRNERGRLDQLNASLQTMINEREQTDAESRRRLQSQTEALESELQSVKRKLNEEIEESKKAALRREYEHEQSQKRIDDLVTSLSAAKEELASAKTARDHLQARVDELAVELRSAEERLEVLTKPAEPSSETNGQEDTSLSKEQELAVEISELRRDLELKVAELERANEQVEVYKNISQSSEERLQELSETNDQYREETESALAEKEAKIKELEQRIEDISSELTTTNNELSKLRDEQAEFTQKMEEQKANFEAEIERLKEEAEKNAEQAQFNLEASKIQAQIATEAQQNYENELVKHAEAAKNVHTVREEANQLRLELVDLRTQAATYKSDLEQKEASWVEMKERFEKEISDLKKRREEVVQQNNLLHSQLESVTQQITTLQRDRAALTGGDNEEVPEQSSAELDRLQEVITYLRREKDIVDVQYQLSLQEAKRLRQQLDFTQSQLDETRLKLDQQRRAEADSERNKLEHSKLMESLNELNLYRESSVTLRAEAKQAAQALAEKSQRVEELEGQMQSLQARVAELENLVELREGELKLSQEDRDHWQQRCQNILSKYDRVDPAELEALKEKISSLETERDELKSELDKVKIERDEAQKALQDQINATQSAVEAAKGDLKTRLENQFKEVLRKNRAALGERKAELDAALAQQADLQTELESLKEQLAAAQTQGHADGPATSTNQVNGEQQTSTEEATATATTPNTDVSQLETRIKELENSLAEKEKELEAINASAEEKFKTRVTAMEKILNARLAEVKHQAAEAKKAALDELTERLTARHQEELEALRAGSIPVAAELQEPAEEGAKTSSTLDPAQIPDEVLLALPEAKARLLVAKHEVLRRILQTNIKKQVEKEKEALRKELTEQLGAGGTGDGATAAKVQELEQKFTAEKEEIIQQKVAEFNAERESIIKQYEEKLAREKQDLVIKHKEELNNQKLEFDKEAQRKIDEQIKNAEQMWEKRGAVKFNMAQSRAALATAKLEVVKKAAEETPEKPVGEVWSIAKDAKPPAAPKPAPTAAAATAPPAAPAQSPAKAEPKQDKKPDTEGKANGNVQPHAQPAATATEKPAQTQPPAATPTSQPAQPAQMNTSHAAPKPADAQSSQAAPKPTTQATNEPAKPQQPSTGAALMHQLQSGIPRGGSIRGNRGSGIPRGRGAPRGRGGATHANAGMHQQGRGGNQSPGRGALNPQAAQFTPGGGNKRARDDGEGADGGGQGKRIRGEGGAA